MFYHASLKDDLTELVPISKCFDDPSVKCAYVTDNLAYAFMYIRDMDINLVTCGVKEDNKVYYEEQFENQLEVLYKNKSGYIYYCKADKDFKKRSDTNGIYYSINSIPLIRKKFIPDVYKLIKKAIEEKKIIVQEFKDLPKERKQGLDDYIAKKILSNDFYSNNKKLHDFYKNYYSDAWNLANKMKNGN